MIRAALLLVWLAGCYPVCVTDADCASGYCQIDGEQRRCIACDPDGRPCFDGRICASQNLCLACTSDQQCQDGFGEGALCDESGACQMSEGGDDLGVED